MPLKTNLNTPPYFDDFDRANKFYHVGTRPGVSLQTREVNEIQSILRNQIEQFGDAIFDKGTIIKGCNFVFYDNYPYVRLSDVLVDGVAVGSTAGYLSLFAQNADGLKAYITNTLDGFEGSNIQKTLYLTYVNSGSNTTTDTFTPGEVLTIFDGSSPISTISVDNGSFNFGKSDQLVVLSAITVKVSAGSFTNGEYIIQPTSGANAQIIGITSVPFSNDVILSIRPRVADLANSSATLQNWTFSLLDDIKNVSNTAFGTVQYIWGSGLDGEIDLNSTGKVTDIVITSGGSGYTVLPFVGIQSANNTSGINSLVLTPENYFAKVKVINQANAVGNGYAFGVSSGLIYQRGLFLDVDSQVIIIDPYDNQPNNVSVGFDTIETIETYLTNPNLYDNSFVSKNKLAPGADRIKVNPVLISVNTDVAITNNEFFALAEWNSGSPAIQHQTTAYSAIGDKMAQQISETSGDFVLDPFLCTTDATSNTLNDAKYYTAVIDPGTAYIQGYRTKTLSNYRIDVSKGLDTKIANAQKVSLSYDTYVRIKEVGGIFQYSTGDTINLYDTAKTYLSNASLAIASNTTPVGNLIGTARIRSMVLESGLPGDAGAIYRLYLFGVNVAAGKNFRNIKSVAYNGTQKGIADVVLTRDATTNTNIAVLNNPTADALVFDSGLESIKNSNNSNYIYRTIDQTLNFANSGVLTKSIAASPNEFFPYSGVLTGSQMTDLYVVPIANNLIQYTPLTGTVSVNTTTAVAVGTSTTALADVQAGDYLYIYSNTSQFTVKKVISVSNDTYITLDSNVSFANGTCSYKRVFPKNVPIPFGVRSGLTANVNSNGNILTLNLGFAIDSATSVNTAVGVNILRTGVTSTSKTANRRQFVKIYPANNAGGLQGPWCLGVSDAFRLRKVRIGTVTVSNTSPDIVDEFYLETNQTPDYNDLSYLQIDPKSSLTLTSNDYLLVEFDYFTRSGAGYFDTVSYLNTSNAAQIAVLDATPVANLTSSAISWEVPEIHTPAGIYYDLIRCFDFRPAAANTIAPGSNSSNAPLNPTYALSFGNTADPTTDKKFPLPNSLFTSDVEAYMGRFDDVIIGHDSRIAILKGVPSLDASKRTEPNIPSGTLKLQTVAVPAYPNITKNINSQIANQISTRAVNEVNIQQRLSNHTVTPTLNSNNVSLAQPVGYSMAKLGELERRIESLEYVTNLSFLESDVTKRVVPSSIDGTLNRFKYGFFVDDFSSYQYCDLTNPQFSATIETVDGGLSLTASALPVQASNLLVPAKFVWSLKHVIQQPAPEMDLFTIVNQPSATDIDPPCTLTTVNPPLNGRANAQLFDFWNYFYNKVPTTNETNKTVHMADYSGPVTLYYYFALDPQIIVKQNGVQLLTTSSAVPITNADITYLNSTPTLAGFWGPIEASFGPQVLAQFKMYSDGFVLFGGKLQWTHDPSKGLDYNIIVNGVRSSHGDHGTLFQYLLEYPINTEASSGHIVQVCQGTQPTIYNGILHSTALLNSTGAVRTDSVQGSDYLQISCSGLRPNTTHQFFADTALVTTSVRQEGKNFGDPLITDASGKMVLDYLIPASWYTRVAAQQVPTIAPVMQAGSQKALNIKGIGSVSDFNHYKTSAIFTAAKQYNGLSLQEYYSLFELKATNSYASQYVQVVSPNKIVF